ncbi:MAG TPA: GNAT family N-acetyltransferase [Trueperaceae bacterium]
MPETIVLGPSLVEEAVLLSGQVGWNQSEADWRRLLELDGARGTGIREDGELVATATVIAYGDRLAWIGMVIVREDQRGRGLGRTVLRRSLELAQEAGVAAVGLDATRFGEPLYRTAGFEAVQAVERWAGSLAAPTSGASSAGATAITMESLAEVADFDLEATGVDRRTLLENLLREPANAGWFTRTGPGVSGYAIVRPGREQWQLGPLVASGEGQISELLMAAARRLQGEPVLMDVLDSELTTVLLGRAGLASQRRLSRMSLQGRPPTLTGAAVRLAAGLELG